MLTKRFWLLALGFAVSALLAALSALVASAASPRAPGSPTALGSSTAAPTVDRLAGPPTVTNPTQADLGAQLFWQHCQPCHGDQAQGLTDDWRAQYPPDHQDCWKSRCHGDPAYQNGFILPRVVPALVGSGTLSRFATAADLYAFVSHAMPFQAPGSLKPEEYWAITAFLMRGHGLAATSLPINDSASAQRIPLGATATPSATSSGVQGGSSTTVALTVVVALAVTGLGWIIWRRSSQHG